MRLTIAICTLEESDRLRATVANLKPIFNVIIVSPSSIDIGVTLLSDSGGGLAAARNVALEYIKTGYVLFLGPDNNITVDAIKMGYEYMIRKGWDAVGFLTFYYSTTTYKDKMNSLRWTTRFTEGKKKTIGSPWIMKASDRFNEAVPFADDTDLFETLNVGYCDQYCIDYEANLKGRFVMYGRGDRQYQNTHHKNTLKSLLHIITCEWLWSVKYIPFYCYIVFWRLYGFFKET